MQKERAGKRYMQVNGDLEVAVIPVKGHQFVMTSNEVAHGYDCTTSAIRDVKSRNVDEFEEGKHFVKGVALCDTLEEVSNFQPNQIFWTKRGIVRLGFFLKCGRAKLFRDWAEDVIMQELELRKKGGPLLFEHEIPLFEVLDQYLIVGDVTEVAKQLGITSNHVSQVKRGRRRSQKVIQALLDRAKHNKENGLTGGYPKAAVQLALRFFHETETQRI